jgi:hypothetical protein
MLGDLVFRGSSRADWRDFDESCSPLSARAIPIFPILGNHEYWTSPGAGLKNFFARFPALGGRHWYSIRYGPLALACLDSNLRRLRRRRWEEQLRWYRAELQFCDEEPSTRGVLSLVHHPPYTNSTVTGDELHVQREIVPPFLAAAKTLGMISGHVHSYERFRRRGRTFLVAGGGGGPRIRLATSGRRRRHTDDLYEGPALRFLHFLWVRLVPEGLEVETVGIAKGAREFEVMDRFRLEFARGPE